MYQIIVASTLFLISSVAAAQDSSCNSRERTESYTAYYDARITTDSASQKTAYEAAQLYMQKWAQCDDQYTKSAREFIDFYELAQARLDLHGLVFGAAPNHFQAFEVGKKILARQPDDLYTLMALSFAGNAALQKGGNAFVADTLIYAARAAQLIESGKTPSSWVPFKAKGEALGYLYLWMGDAHWPASKDPAAALPFYSKAVTIEGPLKDEPSVYGRLASVYQLSVYDKVSEQYRISNSIPGSNEQRKEWERLNQVVDRLMDYYARAVNTAGNDPKYARTGTAWKEQLSQLYKYRHNGTTDGLEDFIANVMNTPLPKP